MTTESAWLGNEQPVGEYPHLPTVARAYRGVDDLADEMRELKRINADLQHDNARLINKLGDVQAERDNIYPLLRDAGELNAKLTRELGLAVSEVDRLHDALDAAEDSFAERDELRVRVQELESDADETAGIIGELNARIEGLEAEKHGLTALVAELRGQR